MKARTNVKDEPTPRERRLRSLSIQPVIRREGSLILTSERSHRVNEAKLCDSCGTPVSVSWRYAESNRGTVHICGGCKPQVCVRSFGEKDAMDVSVQGGRFESNRRKH
jgi:hypothetical protein